MEHELLSLLFRIFCFFICVYSYLPVSLYTAVCLSVYLSNLSIHTSIHPYVSMVLEANVAQGLPLSSFLNIVCRHFIEPHGQGIFPSQGLCIHSII
jgi:hypothetical protein